MIRLKSAKGVVKRPNQRPTGILRAIIKVTMSLDPTLANQLTDGLPPTRRLARASNLSNLRHPLKESRSKSQLTFISIFGILLLDLLLTFENPEHQKRSYRLRE